MKLRFVKLFSVIFSIFFVLIVSNATAIETGSLKDSKEVRQKIQDYIVKTAQATPDIYEISLHAMLDSGKTVRIGCTRLEKLGTPSDPEDVEAIITNEIIFIHEGEVHDFTIPILDKMGRPFAVTGIKVEHKGKKSVDESREIALGLTKGIGDMARSTQE